MPASFTRKCWNCTDAVLRVTSKVGVDRRLECRGCGNIFYSHNDERRDTSDEFNEAMNALKRKQRANTPRIDSNGQRIHTIPTGTPLSTGHLVEERAPGVRTYRMKL